MRALEFKAWRLAHGLSQEQAAAILTVTASTVRNWERYGVPELQEARRKAIFEPSARALERKSAQTAPMPPKPIAVSSGDAMPPHSPAAEPRHPNFNYDLDRFLRSTEK